ncbi:MAG: hypothetical protein CUN55_05855 [Phototrophicales bacterium]|nr:MAG: hypothetical protein CUN55_05855 [Phototrophicales bacterium]
MSAFMLIMAITLGLIVLYAALLPLLLERQQALIDKQRFSYQHDIHNLQAQYELLLESILDLDLDYDMGKIPDDIYAEQRKMLLGRSVYVLKKLDALSQSLPTQDDLDAKIEELITAYRNQQSSVDDIDAKIEAEIAAKRSKMAI